MIEPSVVVSRMAALVDDRSMAMGEWLSASARELNQRQIDIEAEELKRMPEEEKEELVFIYQSKGLEEPQARARRASHRDQGHRARYARARGAGNRSRGTGRLRLDGGVFVVRLV